MRRVTLFKCLYQKEHSIINQSLEIKNQTKLNRGCKEKILKGFMIAGGFCHEYKLMLKNVLSKVKVNHFCYQENILYQILE